MNQADDSGYRRLFLDKVEASIFSTAEAASKAVAAKIVATVNDSRFRKETVLGLATGSTPKGVYKELADMHQRREVDFSNTTAFNLDEYLGLEGPNGAKDYYKNDQSYWHFMHENLFKPTNFKEFNIPRGSFDVEHEKASIRTSCDHYEQLIEDAGGIDLQLLGIGVYGHIGFNEMGSDQYSLTRMVALAPSTRERAVAEFGDINSVPTHAITMGIGTITSQARDIVLMATGAAKQDVMRDWLVEGKSGTELPAAFLNEMFNVRERLWVVMDEEAAAKL